MVSDNALNIRQNDCIIFIQDVKVDLFEKGHVELKQHKNKELLSYCDWNKGHSVKPALTQH